MSKKFFSLIHKDAIHLAPKTKVIPAEEIATLETALGILEKTKTDANQYKKEIIQEIELLKEQAQKEGYEQGFEEWIEKLAKVEQEIVQIRKEMEQLIIPVALKAARKIVAKELEIAPNTIYSIVSENLKAVSQHKRVTIYVNKNELDVIESKRQDLKELFESLEVLSIRSRQDVDPGGCIIETEGGIINAQLENRWRILEAAFSTKKPKS